MKYVLLSLQTERIAWKVYAFGMPTTVLMRNKGCFLKHFILLFVFGVRICYNNLQSL